MLSLSFSPRAPHTESISSMKMILGLRFRAMLNKAFTKRSLSPCHFETRSEAEIDRNVELLASVATALARYDLPVPGGP